MRTVGLNPAVSSLHEPGRKVSGSTAEKIRETQFNVNLSVGKGLLHRTFVAPVLGAMIYMITGLSDAVSKIIYKRLIDEQNI